MHNSHYFCTIENDLIPDDTTYIASTFKQDKKKQSLYEQDDKMDALDDMSSVTNTPISTNTLASPTHYDTTSNTKIPTCTPESVQKPHIVSIARNRDSISSRTNKKETEYAATMKVTNLNPYKNPGKLSNDQYNMIGSNVDDAAIRSYQSKKAISTNNRNRIDIMTTKPLRINDGSVKILLGVTGSMGTSYLGKAMFNFQGDEFTMMCKFLIANGRTLGSETKYSHKILESCKYRLIAIKNPGTSDSTHIGEQNYPKKVSVGILTFDRNLSDDEVKVIVQELKIAVQSILHDENFFTWYLVGVWLKSFFGQRLDEMTPEELVMEYHSMRKNCNNDVKGYFTSETKSNYLRTVAADKYKIMANFKNIPIFHMTNVPLDLWFPESQIIEIIPKFIGTYEEKYEEFIIADRSKHEVDFLYWKGS